MNLKDIDTANRHNSPVGDDWDDLRATLLTPEEMAATDLKVALIGEIISARQEKGLTQKQLEKASGVRQPIIARLEKGSTDPQLSTLLKVLSAVDKTLAIVPLNHNRKSTNFRFGKRFVRKSKSNMQG